MNAMGDFSRRFLAMMVTGAIFIVGVPIALQLLLNLGPIGFVFVVVAVLGLGAVLFD